MKEYEIKITYHVILTDAEQKRHDNLNLDCDTEVIEFWDGVCADHGEAISCSKGEVIEIFDKHIKEYEE